MTVTGLAFSRVCKQLIVVLCFAGALSGCAGKKAAIDPVFFPPAPDVPRVQYLTGFTNSTDLREKKGGVGKLLVGGSETVTTLNKPYGLTYKKGKLYICDVQSGQVVIVDLVERTMRNLSEETGSGELRKPVSVAVDDEGNVYVADSGRKDIAVYNENGKYLRSMARGLAKKNLVAVAVYKDFLLTMDNASGLLFVLDRKTGETVNTIGNNPDRTKNLALPNGMTVDGKGNIHVVNMGNGTVKEYDLDGNMLSSFGRLGDVPGEFTRPRGINVDEDGNIFVVDAGHQVVQVFNSDKRILGDFGVTGLPAGSLNLPAGVVTTREHLDLFQKYAAPGFKLHQLIFVTNQFQSVINKAVSVYGMGEMVDGKGEAKSPETKDGKTQK